MFLIADKPFALVLPSPPDEVIITVPTTTAAVVVVVVVVVGAGAGAGVQRDMKRFFKGMPWVRDEREAAVGLELGFDEVGGGDGDGGGDSDGVWHEWGCR